MLTRGAQLLQALVAAGLFEEVDGGGHVGWRAVSVEVRPVRSLADRRQFIDLPFRLHGTGSPWIPPLKLERHLFLSPRFNAFFKHGEAELFLALRDGRVVGRISAQVDRHFNDYHDNAGGCSASSSSRRTSRSCDSLLDAAARWLRDHGRDRMVGPMDFTTNDELGVLIEGFDLEPMIRQPWQPPYYHVLLEQAGLEKVVDLFMWEMKIGNKEKILPIIWDLADNLEPKHGIRIRRMTRRGLRRDLDAFAQIYNEAWSRNWGFVPYAKEDLDAYAQELHLVFDRHWFMVAETAEGETVGVAITVPDINQVLAADEGPPAAAGLVALPAPQADRGPLPDRLPRRQARLPAHGGGGRLLHRALQAVRAVAHQVGRGWAGSSRKQGPQPRHGGPGRTNRQEIPGLRARALTLPFDGAGTLAGA